MFKLHRPGRLSDKFLAILLPPVVLATILVSVISGAIDADRIRAEVAAKRQLHTETIAVALATPLWNLDDGNVARILTTAVLDRDITGAVVYDDLGAMFGRAGELHDDPSALGATPIVLKRADAVAELGRLVISFRTDQLRRTLIPQVIRDIALLVLLVAATIGAAILANRLVVGRPLDHFRAMLESRDDRATPRRVAWVSADELGTVFAAYNAMVDRVAAEQAAVRASRDRTHEINRALARRNEQVELLLNSSGQGYLSFGSSFKVEPEYSQACERLFGRPIAGASILELLPFDGADGCRLFRDACTRAFAEDDAYLAEVVLSLLPGRFEFGERTCDAEYRRLASGRLVMILTDVTETLRLKARLEDERQRFELIVRAVADPRDFFALLAAFDEFLARPGADLGDGGAIATFDLRTVQRSAHTFKGLFSQFGFRALPEALHGLETRLMRLDGPAPAAPRPWTVPAAAVEAALQAADVRGALARDLEVIRQILGERFLRERGDLSIDRRRLIAVEAGIAAVAGTDDPTDRAARAARLLGDLRCLRAVDLADLLAGPARTVPGLAARLGKRARPVVIEGPCCPVDPDVLLAFARSLVHVFRNAVDHGLERPDERRAAGKDPAGQVRCTIRRGPARLSIEIADDGRGIDTDALRARLVATGRIAAARAAALDRGALINAAFLDAVSSRDAVGEVSGRGFGLAAVQAELVRLGGTVAVDSQPGVGTRFCFDLPVAALDEGVPAVAPTTPRAIAAAG